MTRYYRPESLEEAVDVLHGEPSARILAGGTDVMVESPTAPEVCVDVFGLKELCVHRRTDESLVLGAGLTYTDLLESEPIRTGFPMLFECAREIGAPQIQSRGTLGGNIATSSPVGDTLPVWLALDAMVEYATKSGRQMMAYGDFCTGYRKTVLPEGALIVAVHLPIERQRSVQLWRKVGTRRAQAISKVSVAVSAFLDEQARLTNLRIGLGAVAERPVRAQHLEARFEGHRPGKVEDWSAALDEALELDIDPIDDPRSTAFYRRRVCANILRRFFVDVESSESFRSST